MSNGIRSTLTKRVEAARAALASHAGVLEGIEKTIFPSPAGKKRIAAKLAKLLPPHQVYVEPFAGSAAVFFAKDPAKVEVLSDGNPEIANAYRALRSLTPEGIENLRSRDWVGSKATFEAVRAMKPETELDRLYRFLYVRKFSFGKFDRSMDPFREGRASHVFHRIAQYGPRLKNAQIFEGDYEKVVRKFDGPDTLFFLDPPYPGYDAHVGEHSFDEARFLDVVKSLKGKALITYGVRGKFPAAVKQLEGWTVKKIRPVRMNTGRNGNRGAHRLEQLVAMNYDLTAKAAEWLSPDEELVDVTLEELQKADDVAKTVKVQGITVHVDRPQGFEQTGVDDLGNEWKRVYQCDYGFIEKTAGGDGEELDVFIGPDPSAAFAYWVEQKKGDGSFDEFKVFLGFQSEEEAIATYKAHIPERFMGKCTSVRVSLMRSLLGLDPIVEKKSFDPLDGLKNFGPPIEWSGAVASIAGPERCRAMGDLWDSLSAAERAEVEAAFERNFAKRFTTTSKLLKGVNPEDERYVLGIVLEPEVVDAQNDIYSSDEIKSACHRFMEEFGGLGLQHQVRVNGKVKVLENYLAPVDFTFGDVTVRKGTWLMAVRVLDDELWEACKSGTLTGFSIGGSARKVPEAAGAGTPETEAA